MIEIERYCMCVRTSSNPADIIRFRCHTRKNFPKEILKILIILIESMFFLKEDPLLVSVEVVVVVVVVVSSSSGWSVTPPARCTNRSSKRPNDRF